VDHIVYIGGLCTVHTLDTHLADVEVVRLVEALVPRPEHQVRQPLPHTPYSLKVHQPLQGGGLQTRQTMGKGDGASGMPAGPCLTDPVWRTRWTQQHQVRQTLPHTPYSLLPFLTQGPPAPTSPLLCFPACHVPQAPCARACALRHMARALNAASVCVGEGITHMYTCAGACTECGE
jgi:hypothetical protein